jgi:hypothetical protein
MDIPEDFLHYIWKNRLFRLPLMLVSGDDVEVLDVGQHNQDSGPDFFNAKIRIGTTVWAGNVEVHFKTSDWYMHGHHHDMNYQNIILHVVYHHDVEVSDADGCNMPTAEIRFPMSIFENYSSILRNTEWIPCGTSVRNIGPLIMNLWLDRMLAERMQSRSEDIVKNFRETKGDWKEAIYRQLAKNFGFKVNAVPFDLVARSLPYKYLEKHHHNRMQTEALLFGQGGFLEESTGDDYYRQLKMEYDFFRKKYNLHSVAVHLWRFLRMRPANFPTIRMAQFAALIHSNPGFPANMLEMDLGIIRNKLLELKPSAYWDDHYTFHKSSVRKSRQMGNQAVHNIIINTLIPVYFEYARQTGIDYFRQNAITFLETLPPESNHIIRGWEKIGLQVSNAFHSQSLLQLKNNYCNFRKCLFCQIGNQIIR